jgi:uncharacterized protein YjdB
MIYKQHISVKKTTSYLSGILIFISCFFSSFIFGQNIVAETFNSTGGPYPKNNMCPNNSKFIGVKVTNKGPGSLTKNTLITITVKITAPNTTFKTFTENFNTPSIIASGNSDWFTFVSPTNIADLSKQGAYDFAIVASYATDTPPTALDGFDAHDQLYVAGNVLDLVSASPDRSLCKSVELDTIKYVISYNADSAYASNLPPGVSTSWKTPTLKIFGKPTAATNSPYNYTVRATGACPSIYDSILSGVITVKDLPIISYTGSNPICEGFSSGASPTFGGTWTSTKPSIASISNGGSILGLSPGKTKFYFKTNLASACTDTLPEFAVNPLPIVDPITGPTKVCVKAKIQLSNTNKSGTWTSLDPARASIDPITGEVIGISAGSCSIEYMVVALGCTTVVNTTITVKSLPIVALTTGTKQACIGLTTQLSNTTLTGVWSSGSTGIATISGTGLVTGVTAGSSLISYTVTDVNGCVKSDTTTIRIYAFPTVAVITGTTTICEAATTQLADATASGVWSSGSPGVATIDASGLVSAIKAGTSSISYVVTKNNCSTTVNSTITVNASPIVASITGSTNVCVGATSQLSNTTPGGVWTSGTPVVASINSSGLVSGLTSGTSKINYTVTLLGCSTTKSTTVNTFSMPSVNPITGVTTVCAGATTLLANTTPNGVWSSTNQSIATISSNGLVTGISAGTSVITYSLTINGCTSEQTTSVTINATPIVSEITGNSSVCQGSTTLLSNATPGGTWKSDTLFVATIDGTLGNLKALSIGETNVSYTVTQMGCSKMVIKKIAVQAQENANFTYSSTNYCPTESDPSPVILGTKGGVFSASPSGLSLNTTTGKITLATSSKGNYTVTYKTPGFCSNVRTWDIIIGDNSSNTLTISSSSGKDIMCMGDSLKLIAQGATKYLWNTGKTDNFITVKNPGKYTVTSKDVGCSATVSFDVKVDTLRLYISVPSMVLLNNGFVTLNGNPKEGTFSGPGVTTSIFDPKLAGLGTKKIRFSYVSPNKCSAQLQQTIVVYDTVSTNCTVTKYDTVKVTKFDTITITNKVTTYDTITVKNNVYDTVTITNKVTKYDTVIVKNTIYDTILKLKFKLTTGLQANKIASISLYPNPTSDVLHIEVGDVKALEGYRYRIVDALGKEVYNELVKNAITEIPLKSLGAAGMYQFEVLDQKNTRIQVNKIVLQ